MHVRIASMLALAAAVALVVAPAGAADPPEKVKQKQEVDKYEKELGAPSELAVEPVSKERMSQDALVTGAAVEGDLVAAASCWVATWKHGKGLWPYNRNVHHRTYWCGNGNIVTSRSTTDWVSYDPGCGVEWGPRTFRVAGGVGTFSVDVRSEVGYSCEFVWFNLHDQVWMRIRYNANGNTRAIAWS